LSPANGIDTNKNTQRS